VAPGADHFLSDIYDLRGPAQDKYATLGYRFGGSEPLMVLDLGTVNALSLPHAVLDVTDKTLADRLTAAQIREQASIRPTSQAQIDDPTILIKAIVIDGEPVAGGKGVLTGNNLYVSDISTVLSHRNQGLAAAIMTALHTSARARGGKLAVLSATAMAANLYQKLGYHEVATLDFFHPLTTDD
jgi:GNAT superfamily N-acetyltransferase